MPSTPTTRNRLEKQAAGENLNTWGAPKLNTVLDLVDASLDGWTIKPLTGDYSLTSVNYATDESRRRALKFTGSGGPYTVAIPSVEKWYIVWNATSSTLTITTGAGSSASVIAGEKVVLVCDSSNVYRVQATDFGSSRITSVGTPTSDQDAATKKYVDDTAFTVAAGNLPGQGGNSGKFLTTDGTNATWGAVPQSGVTDLTTDLTALKDADTANLDTANAFAIAMALIF